jgi:hypothetical protein
LASGLRFADVNFLREVVHPAQQWPDKPLKTDGSPQPIPIPQDLALLLVAARTKSALVRDGHLWQQGQSASVSGASAALRIGVAGVGQSRTKG